MLLPRGRSYGNGPNDFQINRTAVAAGIDPAVRRIGWRLQLLGGPHPVLLDRAALDAMPQPHRGTADRLRRGVVDDADLDRYPAGGSRRGGGAPRPGLGGRVLAGAVRRLQPCGPAANQILNPDSLLALQVNGADLSPDHGYPARIIVPALPGVHYTKWVSSIEFRET